MRPGECNNTVISRLPADTNQESAVPCRRQDHRSRRPRGRRSLTPPPPPHSGHADARLRGDARGRDGGVREELAAGGRSVLAYSGSGPVWRPDPVGRE
jgi:hypothetical protein